MLPSIQKLVERFNATPINAVQVHFRGFLVAETSDLELDKNIDINNLTAVVGAVVSKYGTSPISFRRYQCIHGKQRWLDEGIVYMDGQLIKMKEFLKDPTLDENVKWNAKHSGADYVLKSSKGTFPFNSKEDKVVHQIGG